MTLSDDDRAWLAATVRAAVSDVADAAPGLADGVTLDDVRDAVRDEVSTLLADPLPDGPWRPRPVAYWLRTIADRVAHNAEVLDVLVAGRSTVVVDVGDGHDDVNGGG